MIFFGEKLHTLKNVLIFGIINNKKIMKINTILSIGLVFIAMFSILSISSCSKDPCEEATCDNNGTPTEDGDNCFCLCKNGYEGTKCENKIFDKFKGVYGGASEDCTLSGRGTYTLTIIADSSDASKGKIENLYESGQISNVIVKNANELEIPEQNFSQFSEFPKLSGVVKILDGKITVDYYLKLAGNRTDSCKVILN
jgi:hypothetical protein